MAQHQRLEKVKERLYQEIIIIAILMNKQNLLIIKNEEPACHKVYREYTKAEQTCTKTMEKLTPQNNQKRD